jgi:ABC-type glycerol-3-phosphate transport system substrate-binding protein
MKSKRMPEVSMVLLVAVLIAAMILTACSPGGGPDNSDAKESGGNPPSDEESKEENPWDEISDGLPEINFEGYNFRVAARSDNNITKNEVGSDLEETGEIIDDAVYARNLAVKERFNIDITGFYSASPQTDARKTVLSGEDAYDLILGHCIEMGATVVQGNYMNWHELPYVDLKKPWYIADAAETLSINDKAYIMTGEYCSSIIQMTYCMFFNKQLVKDLEIPDPYETVKQGRWTLDYIDSLAKSVYRDLNGNGAKDDEDRYGLITNCRGAAVTYQYSCDNPVMQKDSDGIPQLSFHTPRMLEIFEKVYNLLFKNDGTLTQLEYNNELPIWNRGNVLLMNCTFSNAIDLRGDDIDFGIVPYPKLNEQQEKYLTIGAGYYSVMAAPITVSDPERTGIIIEALNAESYKRVIPAYYEVALKVKYTRDEESVQVLDMILDGRYFDFGYMYDGFQGVAFMLDNMFYSQNFNFVSEYEKRESAAIKYYQKIIDKYIE